MKTTHKHSWVLIVEGHAMGLGVADFKGFACTDHTCRAALKGELDLIAGAMTTRWEYAHGTEQKVCRRWTGFVTAGDVSVSLHGGLTFSRA